jgi:uncharacterized protein (DUF983 family)
VGCGSSDRDVVTLVQTDDVPLLLVVVGVGVVVVVQEEDGGIAS